MKKLSIFLLFPLFIFSSNIFAQELKINDSYAVDISKLPEYVVIRTEGIERLIGQKIIAIDRKKSEYSIALKTLEDLLEDRDKVGIFNLTDLLNAMSNIGFEYIDGISIGEGDITNVVFRKKPEYRK